MKPTRSKFTILKQVVPYIPAYLVSKLSREHHVDDKCRTFSPWSHVVAMIYAQLSHSLSLNDVCDSLRYHDGALSTLRGAKVPSRNGLSHANSKRNADMAQSLFWAVLADLRKEPPRFGMGRNYAGLPRRFKRPINVVDSTTIQLVANCIDWARHRRRKAAAKCHMSLDLKTFLPNYAVVKTADTHDSKEAPEVCAGMKAGEVVVFYKAYVDFNHLYQLNNREIVLVTRAKDNMAYKVTRRISKPKGKIKRDVVIKLKIKKSREEYPSEFRLVQAEIQVDGRIEEMVFITNNLEWSASSICDLYKSRWGIEVFFKQLKQTLQLSDFLGYSENAVRWQIWTALLTYVILRFIAFLSKWEGSFARLFTAIRGILWSRLELYSTLSLCRGTACKPIRMRAEPFQLYLPGFETKFYGQQVVNL